ncbi:hypothetical protein CERSUDRAFT_95086 [Gelatoporia subvermispora B]|uniref:Endonuclease/exonuclease/phosphatase domain-containing protein n=1 Tax=Ceriporiopsis subvermispora (strain B) TaxID=914234 RepID=M2RDB2_CERS8|nr:hypothetical protein CERSUDRAFT_95086 [Gelatoporia subvermispora B]
MLPVIRLATYNLRFDSRPDNKSVQQSIAELPHPLQEPLYHAQSGEQPWSIRRLRIAQQILNYDIHIIGLQEALTRQVLDIAELLGSDWAWIGVGRKDGKTSGEFNPVFYKTSELELIHHDSFWLSETPFEPSKYPGAGHERVCTMGHFSLKSLHGASNFTLLNTHLDHRSDAQRRFSASLLLARAKYEAHTTGGAVFIVGDFNSPSTGRDSGAYRTVVGELAPMQVSSQLTAKYAVPDDVYADFVMRDVREATPQERISGNFATFTGFKKPGNTAGYARIDFVFGGSNGGWNAISYDAPSVLSDDGILASDHRPVIVQLSLI